MLEKLMLEKELHMEMIAPEELESAGFHLIDTWVKNAHLGAMGAVRMTQYRGEKGLVQLESSNGGQSYYFKPSAE